MPLPNEKPIVARTSLPDAAYDQLRTWILEGILAPNERLPDEALAQSLGMSRTPVREALHRLEREGLVLTLQTGRRYVSPITAHQGRDIFPIIAALEALALQRALPTLNEEAHVAMSSTNDLLVQAVLDGDAAAAAGADEAFHALIVVGCGNAQLTTLLATLRAQVLRVMRTFCDATEWSTMAEYHRELLAALNAHDVQAAQRVLHRDRKRCMEQVLGRQ